MKMDKNNKPSRRKYPAPFSIRLTKDERKSLEQAAAGRPLAGYIRWLIFRKDMSEMPKKLDHYKGYYLARGNRRGYVAVDLHGEVYSLTRQLGKKAKALEARLGLTENLPSVTEVKTTINGRLNKLFKTYTDKVNRGGEVYLSFFGLPHIKSIIPPLETNDGIIKVASLLDLAGMKASVVQKRAEWKDYVDLVALMDAGITLPLALSAGQAIYKDQFNPQITLKALSYFDDVKGITPQIKKTLQDAVRGVDLKNLPSLKALNLTMSELNL